MELKDINNLIDKISKSKFTNFELDYDGVHIKIEKDKKYVVAEGTNNEVISKIPYVPNTETEKTDSLKDQEQSGTIITSPIVGTFYQASSPDAAPFVNIGSKVKKGDTLCIIESMKLMNEIESEVEGEIAEIFVQNAQAVEYGAKLFRIL